MQTTHKLTEEVDHQQQKLVYGKTGHGPILYNKLGTYPFPIWNLVAHWSRIISYTFPSIDNGFLLV